MKRFIMVIKIKMRIIIHWWKWRSLKSGEFFWKLFLNLSEYRWVEIISTHLVRNRPKAFHLKGQLFCIFDWDLFSWKKESAVLECGFIESKYCTLKHMLLVMLAPYIVSIRWQRDFCKPKRCPKGINPYLGMYQEIHPSSWSH